MAHFTHRIRYRQRYTDQMLHGNPRTHSEESFRTTPDALAAELIRLTSDPHVTDVRIERIKVERNPR